MSGRSEAKGHKKFPNRKIKIKIEIEIKIKIELELK